MVIDVKPATTLAEAACQMEDAMGMCEGHYVRVCDVVLSNWSIVCRSVDINALLRLADEMDRSATELLKTNDLDPNRKRRAMRREHAQDLMVVSGRIREACGVVDAG